MNNFSFRYKINKGVNVKKISKNPFNKIRFFFCVEYIQFIMDENDFENEKQTINGGIRENIKNILNQNSSI